MSGRGPLSLCSAVPLFGLPLSPQQRPGATSGAKKEQETTMNGLAGGFALFSRQTFGSLRIWLFGVSTTLLARQLFLGKGAHQPHCVLL